MNIDFILSHPQRPANVGAAARAIKTMGFSQLVLVGSQLHEDREARWVAHGSTDILDNVRCMDSLAEVRGDYDIMVATTARERSGNRRYYTPPQLQEYLCARSGRIALVFGCEASGLSNTELEYCDLFSYIPLAQTFPSLNLGQAVMVYGYALSALTNPLAQATDHHDSASLQVLKQRARQLLDTHPHPQNRALSIWLMDHLATLHDRDIRMAHQLMGILETATDTGAETLVPPGHSSDRPD